MILGGEVCGKTEERMLVKIDGGVDELALMRRIKKYGARCEIVMLDKRRIASDQRNKIYVIFKAIAEHTGYSKEDTKHLMKAKFLEENEKAFEKWFSLSDCSVEVAYEFTNFLIWFCLDNDIQTRDTLLNYCPDVERYMFMCLKTNKCVVCGRQGERHHVDAIGMGNDRTKVNDSLHRKICLCRGHHTEAHTIGWPAFAEKYHVKGIIFNDEIEREIDG